MAIYVTGFSKSPKETNTYWEMKFQLGMYNLFKQNSAMMISYQAGSRVLSIIICC